MDEACLLLQILLGPFLNTLLHFKEKEPNVMVNLPVANVPILYPLETPGNQRFKMEISRYVKRTFG